MHHAEAAITCHKSLLAGNRYWQGRLPEGVLVALPVPGSDRMLGSQLELFLASLADAFEPGAGAGALPA